MSETLRPFIKEVILENFMSYDYARIPLGPSVNVICGPNGAGKSTILMGISIALGQTYTERSRKLSELIRRGKEIGRATVVLDNSTRNGRRPVPSFTKDSIILSRFLRRDGEYWFELDGRAAEKTEVVRLLGRLGVNPDNLLIIMHQSMVEEFTVLPSTEKLKVVEEASGLATYRRDVLESRRKLSRLLSEEASLTNLLGSSEQTLGYWKNQYEQLQTKRQLFLKKTFLERTLAWKEAIDGEARVAELNNAVATSKVQIAGLRKEISNLAVQLAEAKESIQQLDERANQTNRELIKSLLSRIDSELLKRGSTLIAAQASPGRAGNSESQSYVIDRDSLVDILQPLGYSEGREAESGQILTRHGFLEAAESYAGFRVQQALKQQELFSEEVSLDSSAQDLERAMTQLTNLTTRAQAFGARTESEKDARQLFEDLKLTEGHLAALKDVSEDVERLYESYLRLHDEILAKARIVSENRSKLLSEIEARLEKWRSVMNDLVTKTSLRYGQILSNVGASGRVELTGTEDVELSGLELFVGFRGVTPVSLNAYTQSGGERSTATVSFLLALQEFIKSPFRGIDEFDIHMDPRNRETIMQVLYSTVRESKTQYIAITPSPLTVLAENAQILTVQSDAGRSEIKIAQAK